MANIGDKFIIELAVECPNSNNDRYFILKNTKGMQVMVKESTLDGFEKWDEQSAIKQLEEFSKGVSDDIEAAYQRGLDDAWAAARKIAGAPSLGGLTTHEVMELFGTSLAAEVVYMVTADQAIEKLRTYEAEKKAEEEIKVGDEVETDYIGNVIITRKTKDDGWYVVIDKDFYRLGIHKSHIVRKTGRHFPQVAELLAAMKEGGGTDD